MLVNKKGGADISVCHIFKNAYNKKSNRSVPYKGTAKAPRAPSRGKPCNRSVPSPLEGEGRRERERTRGEGSHYRGLNGYKTFKSWRSWRLGGYGRLNAYQ